MVRTMNSNRAIISGWLLLLISMTISFCCIGAFIPESSPSANIPYEYSNRSQRYNTNEHDNINQRRRRRHPEAALEAASLVETAVELFTAVPPAALVIAAATAAAIDGLAQQNDIKKDIDEIEAKLSRQRVRAFSQDQRAKAFLSAAALSGLLVGGNLVAGLSLFEKSETAQAAFDPERTEQILAARQAEESLSVAATTTTSIRSERSAFSSLLQANEEVGLEDNTNSEEESIYEGLAAKLKDVMSSESTIPSTTMQQQPQPRIETRKTFSSFFTEKSEDKPTPTTSSKDDKKVADDFATSQPSLTDLLVESRKLYPAESSSKSEQSSDSTTFSSAAAITENSDQIETTTQQQQGAILPPIESSYIADDWSGQEKYMGTGSLSPVTSYLATLRNNPNAVGGLSDQEILLSTASIGVAASMAVATQSWKISQSKEEKYKQLKESQDSSSPPPAASPIFFVDAPDLMLDDQSTTKGKGAKGQTYQPGKINFAAVSYTVSSSNVDPSNNLKLEQSPANATAEPSSTKEEKIQTYQPGKINFATASDTVSSASEDISEGRKIKQSPTNATGQSKSMTEEQPITAVRNAPISNIAKKSLNHPSPEHMEIPTSSSAANENVVSSSSLNQEVETLDSSFLDNPKSNGKSNDSDPYEKEIKSPKTMRVESDKKASSVKMNGYNVTTIARATNLTQQYEKEVEKPMDSHSEHSSDSVKSAGGLKLTDEALSSKKDETKEKMSLSLQMNTTNKMVEEKTSQQESTLEKRGVVRVNSEGSNGLLEKQTVKSSESEFTPGNKVPEAMATSHQVDNYLKSLESKVEKLEKTNVSQSKSYMPKMNYQYKTNSFGTQWQVQPKQHLPSSNLLEETMPTSQRDQYFNSLRAKVEEVESEKVPPIVSGKQVKQTLELLEEAESLVKDSFERKTEDKATEMTSENGKPDPKEIVEDFTLQNPSEPSQEKQYGTSFDDRALDEIAKKSPSQEGTKLHGIQEIEIVEGFGEAQPATDGSEADKSVTSLSLESPTKTNGFILQVSDDRISGTPEYFIEEKSLVRQNHFSLLKTLLDVVDSVDPEEAVKKSDALLGREPGTTSRNIKAAKEKGVPIGKVMSRLAKKIVTSKQTQAAVSQLRHNFDVSAFKAALQSSITPQENTSSGNSTEHSHSSDMQQKRRNEFRSNGFQASTGKSSLPGLGNFTNAVGSLAQNATSRNGRNEAGPTRFSDDDDDDKVGFSSYTVSMSRNPLRTPFDIPSASELAQNTTSGGVLTQSITGAYNITDLAIDRSNILRIKDLPRAQRADDSFITKNFNSLDSFPEKGSYKTGTLYGDSEKIPISSFATAPKQKKVKKKVKKVKKSWLPKSPSSTKTRPPSSPTASYLDNLQSKQS